MASDVVAVFFPIIFTLVFGLVLIVAFFLDSLYKHIFH